MAELARLATTRRDGGMLLRNRWFRLVATLVVTGLAALYIVSKVDLGKTVAHHRRRPSPAWLALSRVLTVDHRAAAGLALAAAAPRARRSSSRSRWLTRAYFVSYAVGQVLPTAVGGDASRIYETTRRHPASARRSPGSVLLERAIGGAVTLAARRRSGSCSRSGRYDIGPYLWIEALFVVLTVLAGVVVLLGRGCAATCASPCRCCAALRVERPVRAAYEGIHGYRDHVADAARRLRGDDACCRSRGSWRSGRRAGRSASTSRSGRTSCSGPLLFLVMLVPFTINGLAVREAFFVSFLGRLGVDADDAFATGFIFFLMTLVLVAARARRSSSGRASGGPRVSDRRCLTAPATSRSSS